MREPRKYSAELKEEAVKVVIEQGQTQEETGKRLSIAKGTFGNRVVAAKAALRKANPGEQSVAELITENARFRKELAEARIAREILKKATAYFAKESQIGTRS